MRMRVLASTASDELANSRARHHAIIVTDAQTLALNAGSLICQLIESMGPYLTTIDAGTIVDQEMNAPEEQGMDGRRGMANRLIWSYENF